MAKEKQQEIRARRKTTSFSMVSNPIIDDKKITPAAGWLYVLIQRWVTFNAEDFVCSKSFIASKYQAGYRMFNRAWDELKEAGYLKMYSHPTEGWEFDLLDAAEPNTPHTYYLDLNGEVKSTNIDRARKKAEKQKAKEENDHYPQNDSNGDHYPQNDSNGNDTNGNDSNGNDSNGNGGNIINTSFKDFNNSFYNDNQSINLSGAAEPNTASPQKKKIDRVIDAETINDIKDQLEYKYLLQDIDQDFLDMVVMCVADLYTASEPQIFNERTFSAEFVRNRSLELNTEHIQYVYDCFKQQRDKVYNIRKYLLTALFNAPDTIGAYYTNLVRADGAVL